MFKKESLAALQGHDLVIGSFLKYWNNRKRKPGRREQEGEKPKTLELLRLWEKIVVSDGVLYQQLTDTREGEVNQLLLPEVLQPDVLEGMHDKCGHQGIERTFKLLKGWYYWPEMYQVSRSFPCGDAPLGFFSRVIGISVNPT